MTYHGHIENGVIVLDEPANLKNGVKVRVELLSEVETAKESAVPPGSHFEHYKSVIGAIDDLPADFAAQHDHYVNGTPKK